MDNKNLDKRCRRYIRITDDSLWEIIDSIMVLPEYKSFNKVINDALFYGLGILHKSLFEPDADFETPPRKAKPDKTEADKKEDEYFIQVIRLMQELILNATMNKSMLCSLFNAKSLEFKGERCNAEKFDGGSLCDTPEYLTDYELRLLKELK